MTQTIKSKLGITIAAVAMVLGLAFTTTVNSTVSADHNIEHNLIEGACGTLGETDKECIGTEESDKKTAEKGVTDLARTVVNFISLLIGAISVVMIIYGGFRYITSGGASDKVGEAKNTILYAIIGLVIVILAQTIVQFVITGTSNAV